MFEAEVELEKKSSFGPLLFIIALIALIVGTVGYFVVQGRKVLTPVEASSLISQSLKARGPAHVRFHVGTVKPSIDERPGDPHYRLLEKAGVVKLTNHPDGSVTVVLTDAGQKLLGSLDVQKTPEKDGTTAYTVPLAYRKLVGDPKVTMLTPSVAKVEFAWKWDPNQLGETFDASSQVMQSFKSWDRSTLISKYGADFYHSDPAKALVTYVKGDKGWAVMTD